jgi:hypothetical protein
VQDPAGVPRMDTPNVLWFFGAFAIGVAAYALIDTIPSSESGLWILLVALGLVLTFTAAALALRRHGWLVPGGLAAALAVGVFPAVAVALLKLIQVWPDDPFFEPFDEFNGSTFGIGVATAVVGLIAWRLTKFAFILALAITALLVTAQLFLPCIGESPDGDRRAVTAILAGAVLFVAGVFIDAFDRRREAFWFHVLGLFSIAAGLTFFTANPGGSPDRGWIPMLIGSTVLVFAAGPVHRATWAVYGVLGVYAALVHYLQTTLNESRWPFSLALLGLAVTTVAVGMAQQRYGRSWASRFVRRPPPPLSS